MNDSWSSYPLGVFAWVAHTLFGRVVLYAMALPLGYAMGALTVDWELADFLAGFVGCLVAVFSSMLFSWGLLVLPLLLVFLWAYIVWEWPAWTLLIPMLLTGCIGHDLTYYMKYESWQARLMQQMASAMDEAENEVEEEIREANEVAGDAQNEGEP